MTRVSEVHLSWVEPCAAQNSERSHTQHTQWLHRSTGASLAQELSPPETWIVHAEGTEVDRPPVHGLDQS